MKINPQKMNNRKEAASNQHAEHSLQIFIRATIILMGFMVTIKSAKR